MAGTGAQGQLFQELLDRYGPKVAKAFMDAVADLRDGVDLQALAAAIEAGDLPGAIAALNLDTAAFNDLLEAIRETFLAGGQGAADTMKLPKAAVFRFDGRNDAAEAWLRNESSGLVTRIINDQREAVREVLERNMMLGENPRVAARAIAGKVNPATGKREGGIIGLTSQQAGYLATAKDELASAEPSALKHYLTRTRRDKRFDRSVVKAIRDGEALPADIARKAADRYEARLLQLRGETIARKETLTSLQSAKYRAYLQAVDQGKVVENTVRRTWRDSADLRVRHTHHVLSGQTVALRDPFVSPSGARMLFPGDTSLGAPASETIGCRCDVNYRIDFFANVE